jgi:hypothetical protein
VVLLGEFATDIPRAWLLKINDFQTSKFPNFLSLRASNQVVGGSNPSGRAFQSSTCAAEFLATLAITPPCAIEFRELIDLYQPKHSAASIDSAGFRPGTRCDRLAERFLRLTPGSICVLSDGLWRERPFVSPWRDP